MKRIFSIMSIIFCILIFGNAYAYEIEDTESIEPIANLDTSNYSFYKSSDAGSTQKYVKSYIVGGTTALQVCSHGSENSGATHIQDSEKLFSALYAEFEKSEIISITPPTCLENGSMKIRCKNMVEEGLIFKTQRECGEEATIILEKTGHSVDNHLIDSKCKNCGEIHNRKDLLNNFSDDNNHYYSCSFNGCTEKISESHTFSKNSSGIWLCSVCNFEQKGHGASSIYAVDSDNENMHYRKCLISGCSEKFNIEEHLGGSHPSGVCKKCNAYYQTHAVDESQIYNDENYHWYKCTYPECQEKINKTSHELKEVNVAKKECECGYFVEVTHYATEKWEGDGTVHYKKCIVEGCNEIFEEDIHIGGTHNGDTDLGTKPGECTVCHLIYQSHIKDTSKIEFDDDTHWYGCKMEDCDGIFKENHKKGAKAYYDEEYHWYICTTDDCNKTFGKEEHYGGEENKGICEGCKMDYMNEVTAIKIKKGSKGENGYRELEELGDNVKLEVEFTPKKTVFTDIEWSVKDEDIATVDENGVVTGITDGITVVYAKHGKLEDSCQIFVGEGIFKILTDKTEIDEDDTCELSTNLDDNSMEIEWRISNEDLGELEEKDDEEDTMIFTSDSEAGGKTVTIYAELENGIEAKIKIKIVHSGATHNNGGECQVCGKVYEKHNLSDYKYDDETGHYKTCSNSACKGKKFEEEPHTGSTDCSLCKWKRPSDGSGNSGSETGGNNGGASGNTPTENDEWFWQEIDSVYHGKKYKYKLGYNGKKEKHTASYFAGIGGVCEVCGAVKSGECVHSDHNESYKPVDGEIHSIICNGCGKVKKTEPHTFTSEGICRRCQLPEGANKVEIREWVFYIATKEYYVEEGQTTYIPITELVNADKLEKFTWTMSTTGKKEWDSSKGDIANDGTIIFGYKDKQFYAEVVSDNIQKLSGEVEVEITARNKNGQLFTQRIKLIKNGPPRSSCKIYFDKTIYSIDDTEMKIKVKTLYDDFKDKDVKEYGKQNMPWYEIDESSINIVSKDTNIVEITGSPVKSELQNENGYYITVPIRVKQKGLVGFDVNLSTEYTYSNHKTLKKDRKYTDVVSFTNKKVVQTNSNGGTTSGGGNTNNNGGSSSNNSGGGSGALAAVGGIALLIILAVIGASKNSRR